MGDDGKGDGFKPTWRDAIAAGIGALLGWKAPEYVRAKVEEQARYQAKIIAEEVQKQLGQYKKPGDG